jgi:ribonuclease E
VAHADAAVAPEPGPAEDRPGRSRRRKKPVGGSARAALTSLLHAGPTPADPFGGGALDIFDVLERVENHHAATAVGEPAGGLAVPEPAPPPRPAPLAETAEDAVAAGDGEADVAEPLVGAPMRPVVIGENAPAAERKRGWWRR